jgi:DNA end-binding protein Ku
MATAPRSIASLTISFGLVAIPVKLYSATVSSERISFNLLRAKDGSRVKQQYIAVNDGKIVDRSEMTKGYEFAKDQYVIFSPQELKELEDATSQSIDIGQFVPLESVDPVYFAGTYYLAPDKGGAKPYSLLSSALKKSKQCAVGRWTSRGKEHVVVIRPLEDGLAMHQLHFQAEVRTMKELGIEPATVSEAEMTLANQLVQHLGSQLTLAVNNQAPLVAEKCISEVILSSGRGRTAHVSGPPRLSRSHGSHWGYRFHRFHKIFLTPAVPRGLLPSTP